MIEPPDPQDKCGVKIDYVARRLGLALAPLGFKRKGRQLLASGGTGDGQHWKIVSLQGDKWNEGSRGAFFVNLAILFPALTALVARRKGMEWLADHLGKVDETLGQFRERLGRLQARLPADHVGARPVHSDEYKFSRETDLVAVADGVVQACTDLGLPWFAGHASLRALADFDGSLLGADVDMRIAAAVLLGDRARAQQILAKRQARFESLDAAALDSMRQWLADLGLDVVALPLRPVPPRVSAWEERRRAEARAEAETHARHAMAIRAPAGAAQLPPRDLAQAWVAEHRAQWRQDPKPLLDLPSGRDVAGLDSSGREAVLLALLQLLVVAEAQAGSRARFSDRGGDFDLDESVRRLIEALLPTLAPASEATAVAVLGQMVALVSRWQQALVTGSYPWGFAALAHWLAGPACAAHRAALRPAISAWLQAYGDFAVAAFEQTRAELAAQSAQALDPMHPLYEVLKEIRERQAETQALQAPIGAEELRRRISAYPEQQMAAADKQAVATLRRELQRDTASGRLPVAWDGDDWGLSAQAAWQAADAGLREALTPTLQTWLEGVQTKPTQRWLRTLDSTMAALPPGVATAWRPWVLQVLAAFAETTGHTEWATTGPRPGVGARLGLASENLLLGLLWWAWRDTTIEAGALETSLQHIASGAWQRLPEVGARAPAVGGLALRMLAGLGDVPRQGVAARAQERGAPRQIKQAVERALGDALPR